MSAAKPPTVIPMWITGFEDLMPEGRKAPFKFLPRPGARLSITFAPPVSQSDLLAVKEKAVLGEDVEEDEVRVRTAITSYLHDAVQALGHQMSGPTLGATLPPPQQS